MKVCCLSCVLVLVALSASAPSAEPRWNQSTASRVLAAACKRLTNSMPAIRPQRAWTNLIATKSPEAPRPGLYAAAPYSMLVLAPLPMDRTIEHPVPTADRFPARVIEPPLRLEPMK